VGLLFLAKQKFRELRHVGSNAPRRIVLKNPMNKY
jgi:hypothetical protein